MTKAIPTSADIDVNIMELKGLMAAICRELDPSLPAMAMQEAA